MSEATWKPFERDGLLKGYEYDVWKRNGRWLAAVHKVGDSGFGFAGAHDTFDDAMAAASRHIDSYEDWEKFLVRNPEVDAALGAVSDKSASEGFTDEDKAAFENVVDAVKAALEREKEDA